MPDLLLELFSEEIPARMQRKAAADLQKLVTNALVEAGLVYEGAKAFVTPRRLALTVHGLPARSPDKREETKGPPVTAPEAAIAGFLRKTGLASIGEAKVQADKKKGDFYVAVVEKPGRATADVVAEIVPTVVRSFPWPKSMRWGPQSAKPGSLTWVRPLHAILCVFGAETENTEVVPIDIDGIRSGDVTWGHRFMAPGEIRVSRFDDYVPKLEKAKVILDADRRKQIILADAKNLATAANLELVEDEALLEEVAGLVEWPVVLMGEFDAAFLEIAPEVIRATIRNNQKCFVLRGPQEAGSAESATGKQEGKLANRFLLVANIEASDGGKEIVAGNARVIRARLSDARYFWETDRKTKLIDRLPKLDSIVFHEKLGTQGERVQRIARLAREIAPLVGADPDKAERAAKLAKADLVTEMVGEFPELQGLMGKYYALAEGEDAAVAIAIEDHYKPVGPNDRVPADPVAIAVALADKLDTLVGFWAIDEKPTGSKDPYALRRAALGVIRIVLENGLRIDLLELSLEAMKGGQAAALGLRPLSQAEEYAAVHAADDLLRFFADRLKVQLREQGARHDLVDAVLAEVDVKKGAVQARVLSTNDLLLIVRRIEALGSFLETDDGRNLLAGYRRSANILRDEENKGGVNAFNAVDPALLSEPEEKALAGALGRALPAATEAAKREDYAEALTALASLRVPVDAFFDKVRVNADDPAVRVNRLRLLNLFRMATFEVADFSKVGG